MLTSCRCWMFCSTGCWSDSQVASSLGGRWWFPQPATILPSHTAFIKLMLSFLMPYLRMSAPNPPTLSELSGPFLVGFFCCNASLLDETPSVNDHHRRSEAEINSFSLRSFTTVYPPFSNIISISRRTQDFCNEPANDTSLWEDGTSLL